MSNEQDRALVAEHYVLKPLDRDDVEVIGRLVQQQKVRLADERARQCHPPPPATGQFVHALVCRQVQFADRAFNPLFNVPAAECIDLPVQDLERLQACVVELTGRTPLVVVEQVLHVAKAGAHHVADRHVPGRRQGLCELADDEVVPAHNFAAIRIDLAADQLHRRGLAGAIAADQADTLARFNGEARCIENFLVAEIERHLIKANQGHAFSVCGPRAPAPGRCGIEQCGQAPYCLSAVP